MRNHLIHGYGQIDWIELWDTATNDIPEFKEQCTKTHHEIDKGEILFLKKSYKTRAVKV